MTANAENDLQGRARHSWALLNRTFDAWCADNGSRMGAALAYYALFSLAPILLIAVAIAGSVFDDMSAREEVIKQVRYYVGTHGARAVRELMVNITAVKSGVGGAVASAVLLFFAASGLVTELQSALNEIWKTEPPPRPWLALIRRRVMALGFVLGSGFLLLLELILSTVAAVLGTYVSSRLPVSEAVLHTIDFILSFGVVTLLLALIYKYLPDTRIAWRDVWTGAGVTSVLLSLGNLVIGICLGKTDITTTFGAAGSLLLIAVWIFYGAQLLYFGAEFTSVHARERKLANARDRSERENTI
jgi:membrane protein